MFLFRKKKSPPKKTPNRGPVNGRSHIGFTKLTSIPIFKYPNGTIKTGNGVNVKKITNHNYPEMSGYYTSNEFNRLLKIPIPPVWNFSPYK